MTPFLAYLPWHSALELASWWGGRGAGGCVNQWQQSLTHGERESQRLCRTGQWEGLRRQARVDGPPGGTQSIKEKMETVRKGKLKLHKIYDQYKKICMVSDIHTHTHIPMCEAHVHKWKRLKRNNKEALTGRNEEIFNILLYFSYFPNFLQ